MERGREGEGIGDGGRMGGVGRGRKRVEADCMKQSIINGSRARYGTCMHAAMNHSAPHSH